MPAIYSDTGTSNPAAIVCYQPYTDIYQQAVVTRFARAREILVIFNNYIKSCGLAIKRSTHCGLMS